MFHLYPAGGQMCHIMLQARDTAGYKKALLVMCNSVCISENVFKINVLKKRLKHSVLKVSKLLIYTSKL